MPMGPMERAGVFSAGANRWTLALTASQLRPRGVRAVREVEEPPGSIRKVLATRAVRVLRRHFDFGDWLRKRTGLVEDDLSMSDSG